MSLEKKLKHYRISKSEYERIEQMLGRPPEGVEWALFSALWSEHCSYKSSKVHLKKLFNRSERVVMSFGENAGVLIATSTGRVPSRRFRRWSRSS